MHQSTTPSFSQYSTKMDTKTVPHSPYSPDLASCDFWLFPKLRGCRYETIEEMKAAVTKVLTRSHKRTSIGPCRSCWNGITSALQPEEITLKGTRVSCVLLIKVPIQKKSGNLFNDRFVICFISISVTKTLFFCPCLLPSHFFFSSISVT